MTLGTMLILKLGLLIVGNDSLWVPLFRDGFYCRETDYFTKIICDVSIFTNCALLSLRAAYEKGFIRTQEYLLSSKTKLLVFGWSL